MTLVSVGRAAVPALSKIIVELNPFRRWQIWSVGVGADARTSMAGTAARPTIKAQSPKKQRPCAPMRSGPLSP